MSTQNREHSYNGISRTSDYTASFKSPRCRRQVTSAVSSTSHPRTAADAANHIPTTPTTDTKHGPSKAPAIVLKSVSSSNASVSSRVDTQGSSSISDASEVPTDRPSINDYANSTTVRLLLDLNRTIRSSNFHHINAINGRFQGLLTLVQARSTRRPVRHIIININTTLHVASSRTRSNVL